MTPQTRVGRKDHQLQVKETTAKKGIEPGIVEQILKGMEDLKIVVVKKSEDRPTSSKYMYRRCIWCDSTEHDWKDCDNTRRC